MRQNCLSGRTSSGEIYIRSTSNSDDTQKDLEERAIQLLRFGLPLLNPSPECEDVIEPFLCFYLFGLCDSSGELYLPSADECMSLMTDLCEREWEEAVDFLGPDVLPQCESLPEISLQCTSNSSASSNNTVNSTNSTSNITCSRGFFLDSDELCRPECGKWSLYSESTVDAIAALLTTATIIGFIGGSVVMVISILHCKQA